MVKRYTNPDPIDLAKRLDARPSASDAETPPRPADVLRRHLLGEQDRRTSCCLVRYSGRNAERSVEGRDAGRCRSGHAARTTGSDGRDVAQHPVVLRCVVAAALVDELSRHDRISGLQRAIVEMQVRCWCRSSGARGRLVRAARPGTRSWRHGRRPLVRTHHIPERCCPASWHCVARSCAVLHSHKEPARHRSSMPPPHSPKLSTRGHFTALAQVHDVPLGESADPRDVGGGDHLRSFATTGQSLYELGFEVLHVDLVLYPPWHVPIDWSLRLN